MRADTASITTPTKPERNFAVTTAIVPVTTAIAQSKKKWKYVWASKKRRKKMKIRLGIEKNVEKKRKKKRKKHIKNTKKKRKKNEKNSRFFTFFWFFKNWLKIGYFGGLRPGTTKNEKKRKKTY